MSHTLDWIQPETIMRVTIRGEVTVQDIADLDSLVYVSLDSNPRCKAVIFEISGAKRITPHLYQLKMKQAYPADHPLQYICVAGEHRLIRLMLMLTYNQRGAVIKFFFDQAAALEFLEGALT